MKREIKFRVWTGNQMEYDITVGRFGAFYVNPEANGDGLDPKDTASLTPNTTKYHEVHPVMQFTGLKDKNGKEAYEGDICKCPVTINKNIWGEFTNKVIKWKDDSFTWVLDGEWSWIDFETAFRDEGDYVKWSDKSKVINIEIVGNIYENPESLNPSK